MKLLRRDFLKTAAAAAAPAWLAACAKEASRRTLHFLNWSDFIGKETLPGFERETGIRVRQDLFSDEEEMFAKLKTGISGYDVTMAPAVMVPRLKALGLIAPWPELPNAKNLLPRFAAPDYDPGRRYVVPYLWGTTGIAYSRPKVKAPPSSWKALWDRDYKGRITMLDNSTESLTLALFLLGLPIDTADPAHLDKAMKLLLEQKPLLKHYSTTTYMDDLAAGEIWLAHAWSGDAVQVSLTTPDIEYAIPREGSTMWVDNLCLIANSERKEEAARFADYLLRPEVAAEITQTVRYPTANEAARKLLPAELSGDARIYPSKDVESRLRFQPVLSEDAARLWTETWQRIKLA